MVAVELPPPPAVAVELPPPPAVAVELPPPEPAPIDDVEQELARLRPKTAASVRLMLAHRGKLSSLTKTTGRPAAYWYGVRANMLRSERWALVRALDLLRNGVGGLDLIPCTKCGLRGHLAGDPDRCLNARDPRDGMGQQEWVG